MELKTIKPYQETGVTASWYKGWNLTERQRERFRQSSITSQAAKARAVRGECDEPKHPIPTPKLCATDLMPELPNNGIRALSLFSGGGGLDCGFDRAGFCHVASYEMREEAAAVLRAAHPEWSVFGGSAGDVCAVDWKQYKGKVDVLHGGPPCQPFSHAGYRSGATDVRDMFPEFVRAVKLVKPRVFVAENVAGLATKKFSEYIDTTIIKPLQDDYSIRIFALDASSFGVPQRRRRVWFVGFRNPGDARRYIEPTPTHGFLFGEQPPPLTMGAREALGLPNIGYDALAPTIRSGFSGPRHTTSVVNSVTALKQWNLLKIWPNGVAEDRQKAAAFVAKNGHYRLSIADCMLLQGFPSHWPFRGAVYKSLGLIGNSVAPPMGYHVAISVANSLIAG